MNSKEPKINNQGFTLIETLVALFLLAILVPVIFESQISAIKVERAIIVSDAIRMEIEKIMLESICGSIVTNGRTTGSSGLLIHRFVERDESNASRKDDTEQAVLTRWEIASDDRPSLNAVIFTHLCPE